MLTLIVNAGNEQRELKPQRHFWLTAFFVLLAPALSAGVELKPETLKAWEAYVRTTQARMEERAAGRAPFLWVDERPGLAQRVRAGEVLTEPVGTYSPHPAPHGLIHDWVGAVFIPEAQLDEVMRVLDDYDHYKDFYKPMVVNAKLTERTPDHEKVTLLMMQKAYWVTAAVETDDEIRIVRLSATRLYSISSSTQVREIADYGKPSQHPFPQADGPGYVWRMFSVTRLEQRDGGVYEEVEMMGLSRGIPWAYRWLVQPLAERLPRNILGTTLQNTREAVGRETRQPH